MFPSPRSRRMATAPHPKPRGENETDAAYAKRVSNWKMSQERLKSVGITGGVNNANKKQLDAFAKKYGHGPSGLKPVQGPTADAPPNPPPNNPPPGTGGGGGNGGPQQGPSTAGQTAGGNAPTNAGRFGRHGDNALGGSSPAGQAARQGLSQMTPRAGRRARRAARQAMRRGY
jgi:hypothetical protein